MKKHQELIRKIQSCNLSKEDKKQLLDILNDENSNYDDFLKVFISILKLGHEFSKFLDFGP